MSFYRDMPDGKFAGYPASGRFVPVCLFQNKNLFVPKKRRFVPKRKVFISFKIFNGGGGGLDPRTPPRAYATVSYNCDNLHCDGP